jgi:TRAP-type C4-dicarboxylate transport system substrate-binding protein
MRNCNVNRLCRLLVFFALIFLVNPLFAQRKINIVLASLVPENTPWGAAINRMAAEWVKITNGEVQVIVHHGAILGDEQEILRKMKSDDIQAAVFTSLGLNSVTPEVMAVSYPFLIRDDAELNYVMTKIRSELDNRINQNGYVTLAWANAGWIKIFSKTPVYVPDDLRKVKLGTGAGEEEMIQAFRIMGYQLTTTALSQILQDLKTGRIGAIYQSPVYAASSQAFGVAGNMPNINISPFMGGILIKESTWRRIPDKYKPELLAVCKRMEKQIESSIGKMEADTTAIMVKNGLKINELNPQQVQEWYNDTAKFENRLVGPNSPVFNREFYFKIKTILEEFRKGQ